MGKPTRFTHLVEPSREEMAEERPWMHIFARGCNIQEDLHMRIDTGSVCVNSDKRTRTSTAAPLLSLTLRWDELKSGQ
jgi:hypothetical protein